MVSRMMLSSRWGVMDSAMVDGGGGSVCGLLLLFGCGSWAMVSRMMLSSSWWVMDSAVVGGGGGSRRGT